MDAQTICRKKTKRRPFKRKEEETCILFTKAIVHLVRPLLLEASFADGEGGGGKG